MNSIYSNCFTINLEKRVDRRDRFVKSFENSKFKYHFFKSIDGSQLPKQDKLCGRQIGCLLNHIGVIQLAKEKGFPCVTIFEDDVEIKDMELLHDRI